MVGEVTLPWSQQNVAVVASRAISLLAWPGQEPSLVLAHRPRALGRPGRDAGGHALTRRSDGERVVVPVHVVDTLGRPPLSWRLKRS